MKQQEFFNRYSYSTRTNKLGGGAFGTVYKAYDNILNRYVAIKVAEVKNIGGKDFSLLDEFDAIKGLAPHPNIANYEEVFTFESPQGVFDYAILQYYPHGNLSDLIKSKNLTLEEKEDIAFQILNGLEFLHNNNVVHRDMKPSNILIHKHDLSGRYIPKIADFGLSKKANTDQSRFTNSFGGGTLAYSSPEQLRGEILRFNTDLWAWAVIVYELFTKEKLFKSQSRTSSVSAEREMYEQILDGNTSQLLGKVPSEWRKVLSKCLVKNSEERVKSVSEIRQLLGKKDKPIIKQDEPTVIIPEKKQDILKEEPKPIPPKPKPTHEENPSVESDKKNNMVKYLFIVLGILILGLGVFYIYPKINTASNVEETQEITLEEAKEIFKKLHDIQNSENLANLSTIFADKFKVYYNKENVPYVDAQNDALAYSKRWKEISMELKDFTSQGKNMFHYEIQYFAKSKKTGDLKEYSVEGNIGFVKQDGVFKINYLKNIKEPEVKNEEAKIYDDTYENDVDFELSEEEILEGIQNSLSTYFSCDDNENLNCLLNSFAYPVKRYFDREDLSYSDLESMYRKTFYQKAYTHEHIIDWENTTYKVIDGGYSIYLKGIYRYYDMKKETWKENDINDIMILNEGFKIISYYKL